MKRCFMVLVVVLTSIMICHAQYDEATTKKVREYMVMDGDNPDFIHAQQQAPNSLTIGLSAPDEKGEGVYELRGDCIWLVESKYSINDRPIARLMEEGSGITVIIRIDNPEGCSEEVDINADDVEVVGALNSTHGDIYIGNKVDEPFAVITSSGEIMASDGKVLLRMDKADKRLVTYFLLESYLPRFAPERIGL